MSTLKSKTLRGVAAAGVAAGLVAASAGSAFAQGTVIVTEALVYIPTAVGVGSNTVEVTVTPTGDREVNNTVVTFTPDDPAALVFNSSSDDRCSSGDAGALTCTISGALDPEGDLLTLDATVQEGVDDESDLGFGVVISADDVEPATMHTGLKLGSTDLVDNEAPEPVEPTEEPTDDASSKPAESEQPDEDPTSDEAQEQLPTTGVDTGIMIGAASAVALAGIGAVLLARRRKAASAWE